MAPKREGAADNGRSFAVGTDAGSAATEGAKIDPMLQGDGDQDTDVAQEGSEIAAGLLGRAE